MDTVSDQIARLEKLHQDAAGHSVISQASFTLACFDALPALLAAMKVLQEIAVPVVLAPGVGPSALQGIVDHHSRIAREALLRL